MHQFAAFQLQVTPPPNPVRNLDNSLTASQQNGFNFFGGARPSDGLVSPVLDAIAGQSSFTCNGCHVLNSGLGNFGTGGNQSFENLTQIVKIPHLRNLYDKIGMFGEPTVPFLASADTGPMGPQVRGFGFLNDGSVDTLFHFLNATAFNPTAVSGFPQTNTDATRRDVEQFLLAFDSDLAPIVGQQVTLTSTNASAVGPRISLMIQRAGTPFVSKVLNGMVTECDLVATLVQNGQITGYLYDPVAGNFIGPEGVGRITDNALRTLAATPGQEITYTAATPGSGARMAFHRMFTRRPAGEPITKTSAQF